MVKTIRVPVQVLRDTFADTMARVRYGKERVVVTFHGMPRCALVSLEDLAQLQGKPVAPKRKPGRRSPPA